MKSEIYLSKHRTYLIFKKQFEFIGYKFNRKDFKTIILSGSKYHNKYMWSTTGLEGFLYWLKNKFVKWYKMSEKYAMINAMNWESLYGFKLDYDKYVEVYSNILDKYKINIDISQLNLGQENIKDI